MISLSETEILIILSSPAKAISLLYAILLFCVPSISIYCSLVSIMGESKLMKTPLIYLKYLNLIVSSFTL